MISHVIIKVITQYYFLIKTEAKLNVIIAKGNIKLIKVIKVEKNPFYEHIWHAH